jgi:poly(3-hydroxybutyrate) depolymerase
MKVLVLNGDSDVLIPFEGGPSNVGATFLSFSDTLNAWAEHNGCGGEVPTVTETNEFIRTEYPCSEPVVGYQLKGMGHGTSIQSWYPQGPLHLATSVFDD